MFQRKSLFFHFGEVKSEVEEIFFFGQLFYNTEIKKHSELRHLICHMSKRHFSNVRHISGVLGIPIFNDFFQDLLELL